MANGARGHQERAQEFLRVAHRFKLGVLPTEQPHPRTRKLSHWARGDLHRAVSVLKSVDLAALKTLERYAAEIEGLGEAVERTLANGRRVFLCGCGATGRLALSLEFLWRNEHAGRNDVLSFMAGGDVALVHSLEGFEDYPDLGARHLEQMGFADGDLLISCTEGGETPYVIGATQRAAEISSNHPFLLYCNADATLTRNVERFRRVYENPTIEKICLYVGPMALAGSTRMQASTVLQLAVGLALLHRGESAKNLISRFREQVRQTDFSFLEAFIENETAIYENGDHVVYRVKDYGITVFTDTTERAPTFSLVPFDQLREPREHHSLCYVVMAEADSPADAWVRLLNRRPRSLDWPAIDPRTTPAYLDDFDFSVHALARLRSRLPDRSHHEFQIGGSGSGIEFRLRNLTNDVSVGDLPLLFRHLLLKQMLNIHSTLVMGRLGRYENNLMTWVTPTNNKLVDRAAGYVGHLLSQEGRTDVRYEEIVRRLFVEMDRVPPGESIVLRTYESLSR
jgi:N-acetylmuramic acid 6-phosphate etherase